MPNQNFRVKNGLEVGTGATISSGGNITAGIISATSFVGSGSQLTGIVASGTVNYANISGVSSSVVGGAVSATSLTVTGVSTFEGAIGVRNGYNLNIGDNNDLRIYNDGTDSRIEETGSGLLKISGSNINIEQHSTNETIAKFIGGGAVELYYNDNKKFETIGTGVTVTGTTFTNQLRVSGVSTFGNTINANNGIYINNSNIPIDINGSQIYENFTNLFLKPSGGVVVKGGGGSTNLGVFNYAGSVDLYYNNSKKFETLGTGVIITGTTFTNQLSVSGVATFQNSVYLGDNDFIYFGDSSDLYIGHNGSVSAIADAGTGDLYISGDNSLIITDLSYAENKAKFNTNGSVELYYDNSKKFETLGTGVTVTGTTFTDQLSVSSSTTLGTVQVSSGIITATSGITTFYGDASNAVSGRWTLGADGSSNYTFTGIGFTQTTNDPTLYLKRGEVYEFVNNSGGSHPFQIRVSNGGAAYNNGVTNNGSATGTIRFEVPHNAPDYLYYQCTNHSSMGGDIHILGTRGVPQNSQTSAYILALSDVGKHISITTGGVTVNSGIFSPGDAVSIYNNSGSNQTITQGTSVTMYLVGTATTGNRTLAQRGVATVLCVGTDTFVIMGGGLT